MTNSDCNHYPISVHLTCKDMRKSVAFWRETLGFQIENVWPDADNPMWANMMLDRQSVMLGLAMPAEETKKFCGDDPAALKLAETLATEFRENRPGVGINTYVMVPDIDAYHATLSKKIKGLAAPKTQFYGIREMQVQDPDGYRFTFYSPVTMQTCQSCGMPLTSAKPGQMYCQYCVDANGKLKPYETVFEGTTTGFFMAMKKMPRKDAEKAAREHLAKMPAWAAHK
jgi:uncharacterized glyoxalase superfamily protein PhnB